MARSRNIKPKFFTNDELVELPFSTRLLFIGLWTLADREGRLEDKPKRIRMEIFPGDDVDVNLALDELQAAGFILRYSVDNSRYIEVTAFAKHQNPHHKEAPSTIPKPEALPPSHKHKAPDSGGNDGGDNLGQDSDKPQTPPPCEGGSTVLIPDSLNLIPDSGFSDSGKERKTSAQKPDFQMAGFGEFWAHYPRRTKKPAAEEAWSVLAPDPDLRITIMASLEQWKQSRQWSDKNFIPAPEKWLKQRQWEEEVPRETLPVAQQDRAAAQWLETKSAAPEQSWDAEASGSLT